MGRRFGSGFLKVDFQRPVIVEFGEVRQTGFGHAVPRAGTTGAHIWIARKRIALLAHDLATANANPRHHVVRRLLRADDISYARIERSAKAFQRALGRSKVRAIRNFYETAVTQPPIPGTVLLFTPQRLRFDAWTDGSGDEFGRCKGAAARQPGKEAP